MDWTERAVIGFTFGAYTAMVAVAIAIPAAWITHVAVAIGAPASGQEVAIGYGILLIVGIIVPPIGVIHGVGIWFGFY